MWVPSLELPTYSKLSHVVPNGLWSTCSDMAPLVHSVSCTRCTHLIAARLRWHTRMLRATGTTRVPAARPLFGLRRPTARIHARSQPPVPACSSASLHPRAPAAEHSNPGPELGAVACDARGCKRKAIIEAVAPAAHLIREKATSHAGFGESGPIRSVQKRWDCPASNESRAIGNRLSDAMPQGGCTKRRKDGETGLTRKAKGDDAQTLAILRPDRRALLLYLMVHLQFNLQFKHINLPAVRCALCQGLDLSDKMLRRALLEMYVCMRGRTIETIHNTLAQSGGLEPFHVVIDLWTSTSSSERFVGIRIFFTDPDFNLITKLLAIRPYSPSVRIATTQQNSEILRVWLDGVLSEYGLKEHNLASSSTDAGSDIKGLCTQLLPCPWDWSIGPLLNGALVEAFGTAIDPKDSTNEAAHAILRRLKKVIKQVRKSDRACLRLKEACLEEFHSTITRRDDAPRRWLSTALCIESVLEWFPTLRRSYADMQMPFGLDEGATHAALCELYSLLEPVTEVITRAQAAGPVVPGVIDALYDVVQLCDAAKPLPVIDPYQRLLVDDAAYEPIARAAADLQPVTTATRQKLRDAIYERFCAPYVANRNGRSYMLDMSCFLHPVLRDLPHIDGFVSAGLAHLRDARSVPAIVSQEIKTVARLSITRLAEKVAEERVKAQAQAASAAPPSARSKGLLARLVAEASGSGGRTPREMACAEVDRYLSNTLDAKCDVSECLVWWRQHSSIFPLLATVARQVLAKPPGAGLVEHDFGIAGSVISQRNRVGGAFEEMSTLIRAAPHAEWPKPWEIPAMTTAQALSALPERFLRKEYWQVLKLSAPRNDYDDDSDDGSEGGGEDGGIGLPMFLNMID
eukprot:m.42227 g.42227  ORF g.42227 m.42227 type:complete len:859 (+) comp5710_c0_seq2:132-2708(+)